MQEKLSNIRLGKRNETLEWKRNDEIGELVREYNRMVDELAVSAEKLARSERESAWREMAKQVAHEIKNPLTPMKLSMQHLQRAWNEKSDNMDELFSRISKTLIEQIDALSNIASEFSNFAQMPRAKNETLDLSKIISSVINLFSGTPNIKIIFEDDKAARRIFADREQLIRLFSNLIKNSIQAIPENTEGKIEVRIKTENDFHIISIRDNGTGIAPEQQEKIFMPSFTTKTSGMGMGLALVKNIAEQAGGKVWFETKPEEGSTFFVELPSQSTSN
jgi:nitrogen fixation/metabolism regulation signal transduction histidine kinase